ncbi:co-chaperone YbbN [uncultured Ramlibacter sp.]|uniref:thioredoxin family protein n=1 Tax=uncultured Ramlibacter sp. TaxID=260755 RepID=UPI00262A1CF1|nr:thioredoxin family protein [uncultured Ramlibacter sp.]
MHRPDDSTAPWRVICLCAAWCGVCRDWRAAFDDVAAAHPQWRFAWVDVEDEAQALGEVDVETFPTLLVAHGEQPLFYGPMAPSAAQLQRLLASLREGGGAAPGPAAALLQRLLAGVLPA